MKPTRYLMPLFLVMLATVSESVLAEGGTPSVRVRIDSLESLASGYETAKGAGTGVAFEWYNKAQGSRGIGVGGALGGPGGNRPRGVKPQRIVVTITIDLGKNREVGGFSYPLRPTGNNGISLAHEFYVRGEDESFREPMVQDAFDPTQAEQAVRLKKETKTHRLFEARKGVGWGAGREGEAAREGLTA